MNKLGLAKAGYNYLVIDGEDACLCALLCDYRLTVTPSCNVTDNLACNGQMAGQSLKEPQATTRL